MPLFETAVVQCQVCVSQLKICFQVDPPKGSQSTYHVLHSWPRHRPGIEVLLQKRGARVEVAVVKLVRDAPPQRAELSALLKKMPSGDIEVLRFEAGGCLAST